MDHRAVGRLATAQASNTDPEPRWGGWADMRKNIGSSSTDPGERLASVSWEAWVLCGRY